MEYPLCTVTTQLSEHSPKVGTYYFWIFLNMRKLKFREVNNLSILAVEPRFQVRTA